MKQAVESSLAFRKLFNKDPVTFTYLMFDQETMEGLIIVDVKEQLDRGQQFIKGLENELKCVICDNPAGCLQCEFHDNCDRSLVSQLCICKKCENQGNTFEQYQLSVKDKFHF